MYKCMHAFADRFLHLPSRAEKTEVLSEDLLQVGCHFPCLPDPEDVFLWDGAILCLVSMPLLLPYKRLGVATLLFLTVLPILAPQRCKLTSMVLTSCILKILGQTASVLSMCRLSFLPFPK